MLTLSLILPVNGKSALLHDESDFCFIDHFWLAHDIQEFRTGWSSNKVDVVLSIMNDSSIDHSVWITKVFDLLLRILIHLAKLDSIILVRLVLIIRLINLMVAVVLVVVIHDAGLKLLKDLWRHWLAHVFEFDVLST